MSAKHHIRQLALRALRTALPRRQLMVSGRRSQPLIHLTFDDGPDPNTTPAILDALREAGAAATFFVLGRQVKDYPELTRRIVDEGHALGSHTYSHCDRRSTSKQVLLEELDRTDQVLREVVGCTTRLFRPPFGKLAASDFLYHWKAGRTIVLWNRDPRDYAAESPQRVRDWFGGNTLRSGDCVLLHDTSPATAGCMADVLATIRDRNLGFASCGEALRFDWRRA